MGKGLHHAWVLGEKSKLCTMRGWNKPTDTVFRAASPSILRVATPDREITATWREAERGDAARLPKRDPVRGPLIRAQCKQHSGNLSFHQSASFGDRGKLCHADSTRQNLHTRVHLSDVR